MIKIKVKNFGPIKSGYSKNSGWIEIRKVTVFIGDQGSGKSTLAKLVSTFTWIEKALVRGDLERKSIERKNRLRNIFLSYHRLDSYFSKNTLIEYLGEAFHLKYENEVLTVNEVKGNYMLPQIMYVPAERNFITYVKSVKELKLSSQSLQEFLTEFNNAKNSLKGGFKLPINKVDLEYDKLNDVLNIKNNKYRLKLSDASSGFQSLVPLYLVSDYLANSVKRQSESAEQMTESQLKAFRRAFLDIITNTDLSDPQKRIAISALSTKFRKSAFINIVEEPEQNLFPSSQRNILFSLLRLNNLIAGNKLIITTHSPYIINDLTLAVKTQLIYNKMGKIKKTSSLYKELNNLVPVDSGINPEDLAIYELDESKGTIIRLDNYKGLPSDENYLNEMLSESNYIFENLLEVESKL